MIGEIHHLSRRTYGWRLVRAELDDAYGQRVNKKLIQAIMRELGIAGLPARRRPKRNLWVPETRPAWLTCRFGLG